MKRALASLLLAAAFGACAELVYINEDWYGHQNSTVNVLRPDDPAGDYWQYRVIQEANPGVELGCTAQHGQLWEGRLYVICKQEKDPGADITGGRINVFTADGFKLIKQLPLIDPSGAQCDGRGFLGIDAHKGYVSSSNGVWVLNLDNLTVTGQVKGSSNPNAGANDKPNTDPNGALYHGQCGKMVSAAGKVFIAHQQYGVLVVDPATDQVTQVIDLSFVAEKAAIGSIVKARDGMLWLSVANGTGGRGAALPYLVRLDPATLRTDTITIPEGLYPPANSWYAWTPDAFVASAVENALYWKGGPSSWFSGNYIYKFNCDSHECRLHIDLTADGENWKLYGCSMGIDPESDELYLSLYHEFSIPTYIVRRYAPDGSIVRDYAMIQNYWFPSLPLFTNAPQEGAIERVEIPDGDSTLYDLLGRRVAGTPRPGIYIRSGRKVRL